MPSSDEDDHSSEHHQHSDAGKTGAELPSRVAQWYYKHGLFLSSYPACAASIAIVVILLSCYPLLNIPMPGTIPTKIIVPHTGEGAVAPDSAADWFDQHHRRTAGTPVEHEPPVPGRHLFNFSFESPPFPWARTEPFIYVQQVVIRSQVVPWPSGEMQLTDAFRAPLHECFRLLETVGNHEHADTQTTLPRLCLHVENVKRRDKAAVFPEYNCLVLSPANLWQQSVHTFNRDASLLGTIFQHHNLQKSKVSTAEMLFGMQLRDTGLKRYPIRTRPRVIQFAITLVLRHNDQAFLGSLRDKLERMYPLHQQQQQLPTNTAALPPIDAAAAIDDAALYPTAPTSIMYVYYPGEFNWLEFTPLAIAFVMLFVYVYFSIRKIDDIRSRFVLATCAVITVFSSLMMSLGLCFFFDLTTRMQSKGVFQYLIILLGLENVLVITKSVVSTDHTFDVKIRVAQGLSREGWTISKTLLTEITILTIGLGTFVPVIQEFCVFAIVGLLCDFFLQMMLFTTVLAMDIRRVDVGDLRQRIGAGGGAATADNYTRRMPLRTSTITPSMTINRSRSHPKLTALDSYGGGAGLGGEHNRGDPTGGNMAGCSNGGIGGGGLASARRRHLVGNGGGGPASTSAHGKSKTGGEIPKRLRIVNFWARTRFFQRAFMVWMIVWICSIIYNTRVLEQLFVLDPTTAAAGENQTSIDMQLNVLPVGVAEDFVSSLKDSNDNRNDDYVRHPSEPSTTTTAPPNSVSPTQNDANSPKQKPHDPIPDETPNGTPAEGPFNVTEQLHRLHHPEYDTHYYLSNFHWSSILRQYNISLSGRYVAVLPPIKLSHVVPADEAIRLRNPDERPSPKFQWKALAVALDPIDFADLDGVGVDAGHSPGDAAAFADADASGTGTANVDGVAAKTAGGLASLQQRHRRRPPLLHGSTPLIPKSPMEILMVAILCAISVSVLTYTMVVFYRCICTRNYAEWRSSWNDTDRIPPSRRKQQRILEGVPILVRGHAHRIECLVTDGQVVASSCLDGQVKMWDTNNGELMASIDRNRFFDMSRQLFATATSTETNSSMQHHVSNPAIRTHRSLDASIGSDMFPGIVPVGGGTAAQDLSLQQQQHANAPHSPPPHSKEPPGIRCAWSPIWCLDYLDNLIAIGCADGRLEFWEASTGTLKCVYEHVPAVVGGGGGGAGSGGVHLRKSGVTHLHLAGNRVVAVRLSGRVDFLRLESYTQGRHIDWGFTAAYRRTHVRAGSTGSMVHTGGHQSATAAQTPKSHPNNSGAMNGYTPTNASSAGSSNNAAATTTTEELRCLLEHQQQGHQQPVTCMHVVGNSVFTGSQDHTLKVFSLDTCQLLYTLHGHCGPITCLFIDHYQPDTGGSGSQDGLLCVWELLTGACMYSIQAHDGAIVSLACAPSYVISVGADERLCVWERFQGNLLNTINVTHIYTSLLMLTPSLLVTGKPGSLIVWDVRSGEPTREVKLDCANTQLCPKLLLPAAGSVICDYGSELRIVRFPLVADKSE